jgi:hypothetical protein
MPSLEAVVPGAFVSRKAIDYIFRGMMLLFYFSMQIMRYQMFPGTVGYLSIVSSIGTQP